MEEMEGLGAGRGSMSQVILWLERLSARKLMCSMCSPHRAYVFRAQSAEMKERGGNQTSGIDFFITQERIVFLDTQVPAQPQPSLPGP